MKISEIISALNLKVISGDKGLKNEVTGGYVSDLLSDVMGNAREGNVWVTLQTHQNVVAVSALKDLAAIIIVKGLTPDNDTIEKSNIENIPVLSTELDTFNITGRLFELLNKK
ncbi:MAG TPA: DRTGG domain-containing protein [Bacteroidales bacterium]|nr:DRTGG domain-containing protein [Bacteroidales bacterium]